MPHVTCRFISPKMSGGHAPSNGVRGSSTQPFTASCAPRMLRSLTGETARRAFVVRMAPPRPGWHAATSAAWLKAKIAAVILRVAFAAVVSA